LVYFSPLWSNASRKIWQPCFWHWKGEWMCERAIFLRKKKKVFQFLIFIFFLKTV
jgi:hypothetical protein